MPNEYIAGNSLLQFEFAVISSRMNFQVLAVSSDSLGPGCHTVVTQPHPQHHTPSGPVVLLSVEELPGQWSGGGGGGARRRGGRG